MSTPLDLIYEWLEEEKRRGNIFPQGAVLSTVAKDGSPRSRVVGTMLDEKNTPKFFTSPTSRKMDDINFSAKAALTYFFQNSLRSISIEGSLAALQSEELDSDWFQHDEDFRKNYVVFGPKSGCAVQNLNDIREKRNLLSADDYHVRPISFIGFKFSIINRISFYVVKDGDFAVNDVYDWDNAGNQWVHFLLIP